MKMKQNLIALGAALVITLTGCGGQTPINVEQAGMLATASTSSDKFAGVVVSENAVEINRDMDKEISELYVSVGDEVRLNEKLFSYDSDTLSLSIDKQELEMDKLDQQITDLKTQVANLEKQIKSEKDKSVLATLNLSLRTVNADLTQAQYDKSSLQAEITYNKNMLKNADVRSPIKGTVRAINESGSPYITIQQAGAYQVKGTLNELSLNAGIMEGVGVTILSRTDPTQFWTGTVTLVDYNNTSTNEYDNTYGGAYDSSMSTSTNYPFYITLDSTDGLLLGQHVYIQISAAGIQDDLLRIPEGYVMDVTTDEETFLTTGTVWGVDPEKLTLTKIAVTLGEYDPTYGTYVILEGITAESYLADPAEPGCREGAAVVQRNELEYMGQTEPVETTAPTGESGASGGPGESGETNAPALPSESVEPAETTGESGGAGSSLVFPEDDEKPDE